MNPEIKRVLITGSSSGIGLAAAGQFAKEGCEVILTARTEAELITAKNEITDKIKDARIEYFVVDFSKMNSVRKLASKLKEQYTRIDILINNAGSVSHSFTLTEDGFETTLATNYLSHFLLVYLIMPLLQQSSDPRILNITSDLYRYGNINHNNFATTNNYISLTSNKKPLKHKIIEWVLGRHLFNTYANSKLAILLFTYQLHNKQKQTGVTANCFHPGVVKSNFLANSPILKARIFWQLVTTLKGTTAENAGNRIKQICLNHKYKNVSGMYINCNDITDIGKILPANASPKQLWEKTTQVLKLND